MSKQVQQVDTIFCHETGDDYLTIVERDGERLFRAKLGLSETSAGPRPAKFRLKQGSTEEPRQPDEFVELARRAKRIRISEQTSQSAREELMEMFSGYQLENKAKAVRTCRYCASAGRYSPITTETAVKDDQDWICQDCARQELERQLTYSSGGEVTGTAKERLEELMLEVQDLQRIVNLLQGQLDPDLTKFDTISATTDEVDPVRVDSLNLHPGLQNLLEDRFETLLPVQSLSVENGLFDGDDQLVVSATATGKTLVGEMAGINRVLNGKGTMLFLVPLVALANQKYEDFTEEYGHLVDVSIRVGASRIADEGERFDPNADVIVGTYEGIDHALRTGKEMGDIGTVVIDEVHTLKEEGRGHRLDGLISRLKYACEQRAKRRDDYGGAQWVYLSATVGNPEQLTSALESTLIEFEERPVPIERHVTFASGQEKVRIENKLVRREFDTESSKGYRGQTIIFTNSRRRCHEISRKLEYSAAPYHAGLDYKRRKKVERQFGDQELSAVVTTAALAAGVDFPASQVIFDSLAMGIEWLSVQEFHQMLGRAGRPDYHDKGTVYVLVEPDCTYHNSMEGTEDEIAFKLLKGEMEPVMTEYDETAAIEETLANVTVGGKAAKSLNDRMLGEIPTKHAVGKLLQYDFIDGFEPTPLGRVVTEHFLDPDEAFVLLDGIRKDAHPYELVTDIELRDTDL
ncbi:DEAD/DEAH box helicase [Natronobacterium gregoryi]|uniref:DEAD/DEAH box helicase n=2 Tax=Natronobacterium gregoryi TaxID=44930 RepID=L0AGC6_NATGS|nr:DEAD/DEAH box helicase [Natronobacterium gregoryi]AFZ72876.1 DNA/RNA helicase, superfamily II [Natronobacterium gregoryi SP2]ELY69634.1 DEAD/DEAH box helicase domain-containing protein [Natronobacterium gregoryi SP2]PLK21896.1 DEAD/DEAH box helicase [Natronobacterium gregoryi SP2]SFI66207.1 helicase [Natronobacterium gregoryi]